MKKRLIFFIGIFLFFYLLPSLEAAITLQGPTKVKISLGDELDLSGAITETADMVGLLKFELVCSQRQTILVKSISLKANVEKTFAENIAINQYVEGSCVVEVIFEVNGQTVESVQSSPFALTKELLGDISIDKTSVHLGEEIYIQGKITRPDGSLVTGSAAVMLKRENSIYLQEIVAVKNGVFSYTYDTENNPAGTYTVEIEVTDAYNNQQLFVVNDFIISDAITLLVEPQKTEFLPGESIKLTGTALAGGLDIKRGKISLLFDNQPYETDITRGSFKITIPVAETIKSGKHTIKLTAEDDFGNREEAGLDITITPIPTTLTVAVNTEALQPTEQLSIHPTLQDQGGDLVETSIDIVIEDAEGDVVFKETIANDAQTTLTLPESAVSGTWTIFVAAFNLEAEKEITVTERQSFDIQLEKEILIITNKGNTPLEEIFTITMVSAFTPENDRTLTKKASLDAGESLQIDLARGTNPDMYQITIGNTSFEDVQIVKKKFAFDIPWKYLGGGLLILVIIGVVAKVLKSSGDRQNRRRKHYEQKKELHHQVRHRSEEQSIERFKQHVQERMDNRKPMDFKLKKTKDEFIMELPKKSPRVTPSRAAQAIERVYNQTNKRQEEYPIYNSDPFDNKESFPEAQAEKSEESPPEKKKGLFSMFD